MKNTSLLLIFLLLFSAKCDDDDLPTDPIDQLPPATQSGAQTFGCLINGEAFLPPAFGRNAPRAFYQFVDGAYSFNFSGGVDSENESLTIAIQGIDVPLLEKKDYILTERLSGNYSGLYLIDGGLILDAETTNNNQGLLSITKIDETNFIVSGEFSFTVEDNEGNEIKITDGRFDLNYTN